MNKYCVTSTVLLLNRRRCGHIQEGRGGLMGSDDRLCLQYLLVIITGITLHRQAAPSESQSAGCSLLSLLEQMGSTYLKGWVDWKFLLIWSLPLVSISGKRHCKENCPDQSSRCGLCVVVTSMFRYADVPGLSTYCGWTGRLCSLHTGLTGSVVFSCTPFLCVCVLSPSVQNSSCFTPWKLEPTWKLYCWFKHLLVWLNITSKCTKYCL